MQSELAHESYGDKGKEFLVGAMANWSDSNKAKLLDSANADDLKALVEFVVSDSGRYDVGAVDESLAAKGRAIFESGTLTNGSIDACGDCHLKKLADGTEVGNADAPNLTKYAGKEWLTAFLKNPGHADFYGEKNLMPAYETTFSEKEMRLIVDWMVGDYYRAEERHAQSLAE